MSDGGALIAHSLAEVYLYLMVTPCPNCGRGPLRGWDAVAGAGGGAVLTVEALCPSCQHEKRLTFALPAEQLAAARAAPSQQPMVINAAGEPSRIIDVGGWVTLFRLITESAAKATDKMEARLLGYEAAQCLDEALKFYEDDNDVPPEGAFFGEDSRRRYGEHPELLARSRLIGLRAKLPTLDAMQRSLRAARRGRKPWWKVWQ